VSPREYSENSIRVVCRHILPKPLLNFKTTTSNKVFSYCAQLSSPLVTLRIEFS
jgi:hypothetical protein